MEEKQVYEVYRLYCPDTNMSYIGVTKNGVEKRWQDGYGYHYQPIIYGDIRKYGWDKFEKNVLCLTSSYQDSREKEREYIAIFNSLYPNGYNMINGESHYIVNDYENIVKLNEKYDIIESFTSKEDVTNRYTNNQIRQIRTNIGNFIKDGVPRYSYGGYWCYRNYVEEVKSKRMLDGRKRNGGIHSGLPKALGMFDKDGNTICIFKSQREAVRNTSGAKKTTMQSAIDNNVEYLGYYWRYIVQ